MSKLLSVLQLILLTIIAIIGIALLIEIRSLRTDANSLQPLDAPAIRVVVVP